MLEFVEIETKYNVGDEVFYLDTYGIKKAGTITEVSQTDVYPWNKYKEVKALYILNNCPYWRYDEEILGYYAE